MFKKIISLITIKTKILNEILEYQVQHYIKRRTHHDKLCFILKTGNFDLRFKNQSI